MVKLDKFLEQGKAAVTPCIIDDSVIISKAGDSEPARHNIGCG